MNETCCIRAKGILFDLDGTLVDTAPDFLHCINLLRQNENRPLLLMETLRPVISNGAQAMIEQSFPEHCEADRNRLKTQFLALYAENIGNHSTVFPTLNTLLDLLDEQNTPWGVVTNKPMHFTEPLLAKLGLLNRCSAVICPDHVTHSKPDPEGLLLACQQLQLTSKECIYIGDHRRDIEAGINAEMKTIGALYGYIDEKDNPKLWSADYLASTPDDILNWLYHNNAQGQQNHV